MAGPMQRDVLHVEGKNDMHVIRHLLRRHRIECDEKTGSVEIKTPRGQNESSAEGVEALLDVFEFAVQQASGFRVGFALDANGNLQRRWRQITARLKHLGLTPPRMPPKQGFISAVSDYSTTVGVWVMPDNQRDGTLEDLLRGLINRRNKLIRHAESATDKALDHGAKYRNVDRLKSVLHAWLAWQRVPGLPYGAALNSQYFGHASPAASAFIAWFKTLYSLP
jgi:hypothetical protein